MSKTIIIDKRPAKIIHNEIDAQFSADHGQRDDREVSTPQEDLDVFKKHTGLPDGWRWAGSKVVPTTDALNTKVELFEGFMDDREGREANLEAHVQQQFKIATLHKYIKQYYTLLYKVNQFVSTGFFTSQVNAMMKSVHFVEVYNNQMDKIADRDPEKLDDIEAKLDESAKQALLAACTLDALMDKDPNLEIDYQKDTYKFLVRQGEWVRDTFGKPKPTQGRRKKRTLDALISPRSAPSADTSDPEDSLEAMG